MNCSFSTVDRGVVVGKKRITPTLCREGILDTYGSGYMGLGYGHCLLRRRWAGIGSQPAYIFHSHGNGPPRPSLAPRGGNVPGHGSSRGNFLPGDDANTPVLAAAPLGGSRRCSGRNPWLAASDGWSLQPPDRWAAACQPSSCPSSSSNLEADRLHRGPDWSDQLTATYFARQLRHPLTLGLQTTFVMLVSKWTIFSGPQSCGGLNYWPCHPSMKSQTRKREK